MRNFLHPDPGGLFAGCWERTIRRPMQIPSKFRTLEALGETLARGVLKRFDRIMSICDTVSKASPPMQQSLQRVSVNIRIDR